MKEIVSLSSYHKEEEIVSFYHRTKYHCICRIHGKNELAIFFGRSHVSKNKKTKEP